MLSGSSPASRGDRGGVERAIRSRVGGTSRPAPKAAAPTASGRAFFSRRHAGERAASLQA